MKLAISTIVLSLFIIGAVHVDQAAANKKKLLGALLAGAALGAKPKILPFPVSGLYHINKILNLID